MTVSAFPVVAPCHRTVCCFDINNTDTPALIKGFLAKLSMCGSVSKYASGAAVNTPFC